MDTTTQPTPELNTQITLSDLQSLKVCVEVACSRGAYRAEEMQAIGTVYNNLAKFLSAVTPQTTPADDTAELASQTLDLQQEAQ
jgi:hypothetical protein